MNIKRFVNILKSAAVAGGVAFLQRAEIVGAADFGSEPWWALAAAALTLGIAELSDLAEDDEGPF